VERRTFVGVISGGLLTAPLAVEAQQAGKVYRIRVINDTEPATPKGQGPLYDRMRELGWVRGQNFVVERRTYDDQPERIPDLATGLVRGADVFIVGAPSEAIRVKRIARWLYRGGRTLSWLSSSACTASRSGAGTHDESLVVFGGAAVLCRGRQGRPRIFLSVVSTRSGVPHLARRRQGGMGMLMPARHGACHASGAWRPNLRSASSPGRSPKSEAGSCGYGPGREWHYFPTSTWRN